MASKSISNQNRQCIAGCIFKYYGSDEVSGSSTDSEQREERYQRCLESCRIC